MPDLAPVQPGDVIRYAYLWGHQAERGRTEGLKDRPCAVVIIHYQESDDNHVIGVCPITHSPPRKDRGVKLPAETCVRLGLDDEAECWVITTEIKQFV